MPVIQVQLTDKCKYYQLMTQPSDYREVFTQHPN